MSGDLPITYIISAGDYRKELNHKIYQNRRLSPDIDVYLVPTVNNGNSIQIPCHRVFLRQCQFFDHLILLSPSPESRLNIDTDPYTLEAVVKYIYTGEIELNSNNFLKWCQAAMQFDLTDVTQKCNNYKSFIIINKDNWLEYFRYGNAGNNKKIIKNVFYLLKKISSEFYNSASFLSLDLQEVKQILCCTIPRIFATQEDFTISVLKWLTHLPERNIYINEISKLRWIDKEIVDLSDSDSESQIQPSTSTSTVTSTSPSVEKKPRLDILVQEIQYSSSSGNACSYEDISIIFNVKKTDQITSHSVYSYSMKTQKVSEIIKMSQDNSIRDFQLLCSDSDSKNIIRLGGLDKDGNLFKPQLGIYYTNSIRSMRMNHRIMELKPKLTSFTSLFYKSDIFLVGGKFKETGKICSHVYKYMLVERDYDDIEAIATCASIGRMKYERKLSSVAILGTNFYISGGIGKLAGNPHEKIRRLKSIEMADLLALVFVPRLMESMAKSRCGHKLIAFEKKLYAIGGFIWTENGLLERSRDVEIYNPEKNKWSYGTPMINARAEFAAFVMGKYIFALGGNQDNNCLNMEKYDPGSNTWSMEHCPNFPTNSDFFINTILRNA